MTRWNKPMRTYRAPVLICARCAEPIKGEVKMRDGQLFHVVCASRETAA